MESLSFPLIISTWDFGAETIHQHLAFKKGEKNHKYRTGMRKRLNFDVSIKIFDKIKIGTATIFIKTD